MTIDLVRIVLWIIGLTISLVTVWSARKPIAATAYLLALFVGAISGVPGGHARPDGERNRERADCRDASDRGHGAVPRARGVSRSEG